ncbi:GntR family transcriptional regulator [Pseudogracilibacillus auburnensis]|uniref:GntR family transcriptional regulator n=1 Tax=Pseudogracilibacillus auburnensis TaxID=1494959 RepID=UPI001A97C16A|nr:GntR family transcriptional regulator [Pseudogracilibacillus auburnensis]MBO1003190.1 GntR family transcriptional regulator [Pseudogracilibacillus auburnensis]
MSKTKSEIVYNLLLEKIKKGEARPGSRLVISQIAKEFNVSESPVREVIQRLAQEGYITLTPHAGPTVKSLSPDEVRQIFEIRSGLESLAARLAVNHISNAHIKNLEHIVEKSKDICEKENYEEYLQLNTYFHKTLYQHCYNDMLIKMIEEITGLSARYPNYYQDKETMQVSIKEHEEILKALNKRDEELIEQLLKEHLNKVIPKLIKIVEEASKN